MELTLLDRHASSFRAGYSCPCGCTPSVEYARGADVVSEGCCCGNHFAVGPAAASTMQPKAGFRSELQTFDSPWGERLEAAWLVGPSVHGPSGEHDHEHGDHEDQPAAAIDPVCGMTVVSDAARDKGLHSNYQGTDYYFCGKGCKLEFDDDPQHYLAPGYVPSM
jgi:YHS domain-containing protein